jgi:hypothetical protein
MVVTMLRRLACLILGLLLSSCGGGGGGGGSGSVDNSPPEQLTSQQRMAATSRLAERFDQIAGTGEAHPGHWEELRAWAALQPEFSEVGLGDKLLWARFTDGRYFLYTDNWRPLPGPEAAAARAAQARSLPLLKGVPEVPQSEDALLLRFFDDDFLDAVPVMQHTEQALKEHGWKVAAGKALTVSALKSAAELGFLFLTSHSGEFGPVGSKEFAVMTDDQVSPSLETDLATDLSEGNVIYHRTRLFWKQEPRYAVTSKFVRKHMKFSPSSLVILLSCHSGSNDGADGFRKALFDRGAGTVIGWDGNSNASAYGMVDRLVDRLAGMNVVDSVSPPNRPHVLDDVWDYLDTRGLLVTPPAEAGETPTPVVRFGAGFQMLQPIVSELQMTGIDKLVVHGEFGAGPVKVSVGGQEFAGTVAADGKSVDVQIGSAAFGDVVVSSRERKSNRRVLGSWRGQVKYMQQEGSGSCGPVFQDAVTLQLHLRADMHGTRDTLDGPTRNNRQIFMPAGDTQATWASTGQCVSGGFLEERWTGSGPFALTLYDTREPPPSVLRNVLLVRIDAIERRFQLALAQSPTAQMKTVTDGDGTAQNDPLLLRPDLQSYLNLLDDFTNLMPFGMFLPFGTGSEVNSGHHRAAAPEDPDQILTVDWTAMPVSPAYDDRIGW